MHEFRTSKQKKNVLINVCKQTLSLQGTVSTFAQPQIFRFLSVGTLESLTYSPLIRHEEPFYQLTLGACQRIITAPGPVTGHDSLWCYLTMHDLIQVDDACELIFYSICNCMCFYPRSHTAKLYCLTCICFWSVYSVCFVLDFILYTDFSNEFVIDFDITY